MSSSIELPDVNVLVAASLAEHPKHELASSWLDAARRDDTIVTYALTPVTEMGLSRLLMNPLVSGRRYTFKDIQAVVDGIRNHPCCVWWPDDTSLQRPAIDTSGITGFRQLTDFHLLSLAKINHGVSVSLDQKLQDAVNASDRKHIRILS